MSTKLNKSQTTKLSSFQTMSAKIRFLNSLGMSRGDIGRYLTKSENRYVRYQWVKNVLDTKVKTPKES